MVNGVSIMALVNGVSIMAPALCTIVKQAFKFVLEWHVLIELYWQFETDVFKGFSISKLVKIWVNSLSVFIVLLVKSHLSLRPCLS